MTKPRIALFFEKATTLRDRRLLKQFLIELFARERVELKQLNYIFCSDEELLTINRQFLDHDFLTDVITFPLSAEGDPVEAEIYISVDRVRDNAAMLQTNTKQELHRVIFHGALHLCGYRDKTRKQIAEIRGKEDEYLERYFAE